MGEHLHEDIIPHSVPEKIRNEIAEDILNGYHPDSIIVRRGVSEQDIEAVLRGDPSLADLLMPEKPGETFYAA